MDKEKAKELLEAAHKIIKHCNQYNNDCTDCPFESEGSCCISYEPYDWEILEEPRTVVKLV